jgi:hypothetical protein
MPVTPVTAGYINRRITIQTRLGKRGDLVSKINRTEKRAKGVVQAVDHLTSKSEVLSSNSSTTKK